MMADAMGSLTADSVSASQSPLEFERRSTPPIRVVVQHGELWERRDLSRYFSPRNGFALLQSTGTADEVLQDCERVAPCVLIASPGLFSGTDLARLGERVHYGRLVQVITMGDFEDNSAVEHLLRAGCMGFLGDDVAPRVLKKAVRSVAAGELWASRRTVSRLFQHFLVQAGSSKLTNRELSILKLIGQGLTNRAIAERLCISRDTVRWHIRSLYSKTGVKDRLHATVYARKLLPLQG